ncbi:hypothetical protein [Acidocella sp.]|uniref:hypothetical protein n=1 Tax=Acidocella sp. TaxID=50710 RepID=UPI0034486D9C
MSEDKMWECRHSRWLGDTNSIAEIIPEGDALLCASLHEAEKGIAAIAAGIAMGAAADFSFGHLAADVAL